MLSVIPLQVWLLLEEKRIPYTMEKINMRSYGDKPQSFLRKVRFRRNTRVVVPLLAGRDAGRRAGTCNRAARSTTAHRSPARCKPARQAPVQVPQGLLPVIELDGKVITESLDIMLTLDEVRSTMLPQAFPGHSPRSEARRPAAELCTLQQQVSWARRRSRKCRCCRARRSCSLCSLQSRPPHERPRRCYQAGAPSRCGPRSGPRCACMLEHASHAHHALCLLCCTRALALLSPSCSPGMRRARLPARVHSRAVAHSATLARVLQEFGDVRMLPEEGRAREAAEALMRLERDVFALWCRCAPAPCR